MKVRIIQIWKQTHWEDTELHLLPVDKSLYTRIVERDVPDDVAYSIFTKSYEEARRQLIAIHQVLNQAEEEKK